MENASTECLYAIIERQQSAFAADMNPTVAVRKDRLDRLAALGEKHAAQIVEAIGAFVEQMHRAVAKMYPRLAANPDYTSIVSDRHFARLQALLEDARVKGARLVTINPAGEAFDPAARKQPPVLVLGATAEMKLMQEEIFGPTLPVLGYDRIEEAILDKNKPKRLMPLSGTVLLVRMVFIRTKRTVGARERAMADNGM